MQKWNEPAQAMVRKLFNFPTMMRTDCIGKQRLDLNFIDVDIHGSEHKAASNNKATKPTA